jgi:MarR family transcriptional regulator, organic hydroperoxide resistance regulator
VTSKHELFDEQIGFLVWDTARKISREFALITAGYGINSGLIPFLRSLHLEDGVTQRQLADSVQMRTSTTLHAVRELERLKLVRRDPSRVDGRKIHVYLTDRGRKLCKSIVPEAKQFNKRLLRGLSSREQESLRELLRRVRDNTSVLDGHAR